MPVLCPGCVRAVSGLCGADSRVQAGREEEHQGRLLQEQMQVRTGVFLLFFSYFSLLIRIYLPFSPTTNAGVVGWVSQ